LEKESSVSTKQVLKDHLDSEWTTIVFKLADNKIQGGLVGAIDDTNQFLIAGNFSLSNWIELVTSNPILIGKICLLLLRIRVLYLDTNTIKYFTIISC